MKNKLREQLADFIVAFIIAVYRNMNKDSKKKLDVKLREVDKDMSIIIDTF